ncbi:MAG: response regulator transcription factor, partial [Saprospiraceae bacterium]|nr:response regulator transcription factor [Saprospiraceae bacterium]
MIKIIIVDDHQLFRDGLEALISTKEDFQILKSLGTGKELMEALEADLLPDIVLLDLSMPEMDGFEVLRQVKGKFPEVKFIVISMHDDGLYISKCVRSGAYGYLLKNT